MSTRVDSSGVSEQSSDQQTAGRSLLTRFLPFGFSLTGRAPARAGQPAEPEVVLVTGASTGLGLAFARALLGTEYRVVLTARRESLDRFAAAGIVESSRIWIRPLDVTSRSQRIAVVREVEERWGGVDVLVNNAGVAYRSVVEHVNETERLAQMDVNFLSAMHLMRLVLPGMRERRQGRIINVSSVGGMMAMPTMAIYSASKFALEGATEALWYEVRPWNVQVSLFEPGFIRSPSFQRTRYTLDGRRSQQRLGDPYHAHYESMGPFIERLMNRAFATPERVARRLLATLRMRRPPLRVAATIDARVFGLLRRLLPQRLYHRVLYHCLPQIRTWGHEPRVDGVAVNVAHTPE